VGKFDAYLIDLKNMDPAEIRNYEYLLDNRFFMNIGEDELQKGKVNVSLTVERKPSFFQLEFHFHGMVIVSCDRCLDEMEIPVESDGNRSNYRLIVKLGKEYAEESDEILIISEEEGTLNLAWFLYEFVALAIPMRHIHSPGKCNKSMSAKLKKHSTRDRDDDEASSGYEDESVAMSDDEPETETVDPRWDKLKDLKDEI
jgi:uncharacterized metal-binding protein YceD (DUF177 family)